MRVKELLKVIAGDTYITVESTDGYLLLCESCKLLRRSKPKELDAEVVMAYPAPVSTNIVSCELIIQIDLNDFVE